jgi:xylan 1,4-beta-xylosidase
MYSSYTAASFARIYELADIHNVHLKGVLSWSFEFEDQLWFDGFRDLATNGVDKPILNVFRMFGMMTGDRVKVENEIAYSMEEILERGVRGEDPDVHALACCDEKSIHVMVWNYHDDDLPADATEVEVVLKEIQGERLLLHHYRIDQNHSNSYEVWKKMGSPQDVSQVQYAELEKSGQLELLESPEWIPVTERKAVISFILPRQGVSLLRFTR